MSKKYFSIWVFLFSFLISAYQHSRIKIMGTVSGRAISDRQVAIDVLIENPHKMKEISQQSLPTLSDPEMDQGFQRVLTQMMIVEEGRIIGLEKIPSETLQSEVSKIKNKMGSAGFLKFLKHFEIKETDVKEIVAEKLHVKYALQSKLQSAHDLSMGAAGVPAKIDASKVLEEWLKQLRSRYRVQIFRYETPAASI